MLQKSSTLLVLEQFFLEPSKEHYLLDISRNTKLAHTSVKNNLTKLTKSGLIEEKIQIKGKRKFPVYTAKVDKVFKRQKIIYNLSALLDSGLIEFLEDNLTPKSIVVFGSYRRGEDMEDSDIDLFIEGIEEKINLNSFSKKLKRIIQLHFKKEFKEYPKELKNNIINGVVVSGFLEGYK